MHEVGLLLLVVEVQAPLVGRGQDERVDPERGDAEAGADLAESVSSPRPSRLPTT